MKNKSGCRIMPYLLAWAVHIFTASAVFIGLLSLIKIYQHEYVVALWLMAITVVIDSVDGSLARLVNVKKVLPKIDGTLLDNMVDYLNYVVTPSFFLLVKPDMLPPEYDLWLIFAITLTSAYQFCQDDAKTPDHFLKDSPVIGILLFFTCLFLIPRWLPTLGF
ncbi:phosphatidylserine synthase [Legionella oakridgensis ATCC 33761 = DSM 21215]|uniref:Phosphatidylserine synthase n=1 Tax=Legionella oakridgensis ATCC 33761 = DSM 21215 TaxID=1268635 RepID=W0B947_9GAMM|nr:phosphatidylserine synthase [Legionella oakridgensis ATCC 33761 = DSM 21215]